MSPEEFVDRKLQRHLHKRLKHHNSHHHKNEKKEEQSSNHVVKRSVDGLPDLVDW